MKLKLDEDLGLRGRDLLTQAGDDVCTVPAQDLCCATDEEVAARCLSDVRGIVTLDLDFATRSGSPLPNIMELRFFAAPHG